MEGFNEISFPRSQSVRFPDMCIRCHAPHPATKVPIDADRTDWYTWILWFLAPRFRIWAPACAPCRRRMLLHLWLERFLTWPVYVVGALIAVYFYRDWPRGTPRRLAQFGTAIGIILVPNVAIMFFLRRPMQLSADSKTATYAFDDYQYALQFSLLNDDEGEPVDREA